MLLTLVNRQPETHDTERFYFEPSVRFEYTSGQFLRWTLEINNPDDREIDRFFTIASSPTEELIMLCTKFNTERSSTFKLGLKNMTVGQTIDVKGPMGSFVLPDDTNQSVLFVAGGIGVTPYRSMLKYMYDSNEFRPIKMLYGARSEQDFAFRKELDKWAPKIGADISYSTQQLTAERVYNVANGSIIYLSGPQPMAEGLKRELLELGVDLGRIKTDFFPGYSQI